MNPAGDHQARLRGSALANLRRHWSEYYAIDFADGQFTGTRKDNGVPIRAATAGELRKKLLNDFTAKPVITPGL